MTYWELRDQIIEGLAACLPETDKDAAIGCEGCPYGCCKADAVRVPVTLLEDVRALLKAQPPRVMTREEIENGVGHGWIEEWYPADEEEGTAEYWELLPCAWCHGGVVQTDEFGSVDMTTPEMLKTHYGKRYGLRIWDQYPTGEWGRPWDE